MWTVKELKEETFVVEKLGLDLNAMEEGVEVEIEYSQFHHRFWPGFAMTADASQCMTIPFKYTIWGWESVSKTSFSEDDVWRRKYISISRAKGKDLVQIVA